MKVERARPCPTHTHTHTHTHTRWWGPRGLPGQVAGPWEYSWTQSPLCAGAPTGLSAVTVTTKQTSLHGGSSPSKHAQAHWPSPGLQPPHPSGVSVEGLALFAPLFFPVAVAAVSLPLLRPPALWNGTSLQSPEAWASGLEMGPLTAQGACMANRSFQPWKVGPPC